MRHLSEHEHLPFTGHPLRPVHDGKRHADRGIRASVAAPLAICQGDAATHVFCWILLHFRSPNDRRIGGCVRQIALFLDIIKSARPSCTNWCPKAVLIASKAGRGASSRLWTGATRSVTLPFGTAGERRAALNFVCAAINGLGKPISKPSIDIQANN